VARTTEANPQTGRRETIDVSPYDITAISAVGTSTTAQEQESSHMVSGCRSTKSLRGRESYGELAVGHGFQMFDLGNLPFSSE
jgi:hypothetical protein